jgi:hypothetical protein
MAKYTVISLEEMVQVLDPAKGWVNATAELQTGKFPPKEHVIQYEIPKFPGVVVRVYTSIHVDTAKGKGCGKDAIRVCAVDTLAKGGAGVGLVKVSRVHRVEGWRTNLKARCITVLKETYKRQAERIEKGYWHHPADKPTTTTASVPVSNDDAGPALPTFPVFNLKKTREAWVRTALKDDARFALWALETIYAYQTAEEQSAQVTVEHNGVGFSGVHAEIMSSFAEQLAAWKTGKSKFPKPLSEKQQALVHKIITKYAKQIITVLEAQGVAQVVKAKKGTAKKVAADVA